jgi:hypothetical protein
MATAFKQDPSKLLSILPSPDLRLSNVITVSWDGAVEPSRESHNRGTILPLRVIVNSFFKKLLCTDSGKVGILNEISNHFAVVEENNRHMLHLHGFAWVTGNMNFTKLQDRVLADLDLRNRLVTHLQTAVSEVVDEMWAEEYKDGHGRFVDKRSI